MRTVMYGVETWAMRVEEQTKLDVMKMKYFRSKCGMARIYGLQKQMKGRKFV